MASHYHSSGPRQQSPLCSADYGHPPSALRRAVPPQWMRSGLAAALALTVVCLAAVLVSPMDEYVVAPGQIRPAELTYVFSRSSGILEAILVNDGTRVVSGQALARLDPWQQNQMIEQIAAEVAEAEAELNLARAASRKVSAAPVPAEFLFSGVEVQRQQEIQEIQQDYLTRLQDLQKTGAASGTELLNVRLQLIASESMLKRSQLANAMFTGAYGEAAVEEAGAREAVAKARLEALNTRLTQAKADLARLEVLAPTDGRILATARRHSGEPVNAGDALFTISHDGPAELRLYASEDRVDRIRPGQRVRFRANNNPDRLAPLATGVVTEVARDRELTAELNEESPDTPYRIKVAIESEPYPLAVGATVQAEIIIARRPFWRLLFLKARGTPGLE